MGKTGLTYLLFSVVQILGSFGFGQTWQSISKIGTFETAPYRQFSIDPYRNNIWFVNDTKVSVLENSGAIHLFTSSELGTLWMNDMLKFTFTPTEIYYNKNLYGFHSFTNYSSVLIDSSFCDYFNLTSNYDTVYVTMANQTGFRKFYNSTTEIYGMNYAEIDAKGSFIYGNNGSSVVYKYEPSSNTSTILNSDPQYLWTIFHDTKYSRKSDTLFVAGKKGISYAYNYDFLDTITPNNTINMPSPNVLEIEFDDKDSLWAVFGDVNDTPFALAKLEGNTWTNRFYNSNSPIDFSNFYGLEIDTLGNLWVADLNYLHTFLTPNSPTWLGLHDNGKTNQIKLFPNPATKTIHLEGISEEDQVIVFDFQGNKCPIQRNGNNLNIESLPRGLYLIFVNTKYGYFCHRLIKQ
jgi:ligand-binding sensor domain-containing protein